MRRLLWIGDAACSSGFARSTHAVCDYLDYRANPTNPDPWDVTVLGINYRGDPHTYPYPIYPAFAGGDIFGVGRTVWMCDLVRPDVIAIQQDPWNFPAYVEQLAKAPEYQWVPLVGFVAVDGLNCRGEDLKSLSLAIFWTHFGRDQAALGGYTGVSAVVPLGVDTKVFTPGDRTEARRYLGLPERFIDGYIVGNVNRNQPRKRMDLTVRYFAHWWNDLHRPRDVYLFLHVAPTGEFSYDLKQLAKYYGVNTQLIMYEPEPWNGRDNADMAQTYRAFDVQVTTTQGEGDGLTTKEGMACGIPQIVPDWAALGEWTKDYALRIPCTSTAATIGMANAIGGIADEDLFVKALDRVYQNPELREGLSEMSLKCARQLQYRWASVGRGFARGLESLRITEPAAVS